MLSVLVNGRTRAFVARSVAELTPHVLGEQEVRDLVERMLVASGRRVDVSKPAGSRPSGNFRALRLPPVDTADGRPRPPSH